MLTKDSFISSISKIPFSKVKIDGLGEVGLRLFRDGEAQEVEGKNLNEQIAYILIGSNSERIFSDEDIHLIEKDMPFAYKKEIMQKWNEVNGLDIPQEEVKKN